MAEPAPTKGFLEVAAVNPRTAALLVRGWVVPSGGVAVEGFEVRCDD